MAENLAEQEPSNGDIDVSLKDIIAVQQAHEAELAQQRQKEENERQRQEELRVQAGGDYASRVDLVAESKEIQRGIEEAHAAQIQERLDNIDRLKESQLQKEEELAQSEREFNDLKERLTAINALVEGKPETDIAELTKKALKKAQDSFEALSDKRTIIIDEIEKIKMGQISDEEIARYKGMVERQQKITDQLIALEENPALIELLTEEAKNEAQLRNTLKMEVLRAAVTYFGMRPERQELVEKITDQFLTEEISFREINKIKDPQQKMQAMQALVQTFIESFALRNTHEPHELKRIYNYESKKDKIMAGKLLQNLVGGYGTSDFTPAALDWSVRGISANGRMDQYGPAYEQGVIEGVRRHLGSLNLLRANSMALENSSLRHEITVGFDPWGKVDQEFRSTGEIIVGTRTEPIILKDTSPAQKDKIEKEYELNYKATQELVETATRKNEQEKLEKRAAIEGEIKQLEAILVRSDEIDLAIRNDVSITESERSINICQSELNRNRFTLDDYQQKISTISPLSFIRKRELQKQYDELILDNEQNKKDQLRYQGQLEKMQKLLKERAEIGYIHLTKNKIDQLRAELSRIR